MSSLSTISSGMEESPEDQQLLVDTTLSLVTGAGSRAPAQAPGRKGKRYQLSDEGGAAAATTQRRKIRTRTVHGGSGTGRSAAADEEEEEGRDDRGAAPERRKKKLRLTGEQAALLEDCFRAHNILSHGEKHGLARRAGLQPRQVEVWFQNRRARTKLKQTEADRDLLRWRCQQLGDENARLRREIAAASSALSAAAMAAPCPSCSSQLAVAPAPGRLRRRELASGPPDRSPAPRGDLTSGDLQPPQF